MLEREAQGKKKRGHTIRAQQRRTETGAMPALRCINVAGKGVLVVGIKLIRFRSHNEVVAMEATNLFRPPMHGHPAPLRQQSRVVSFGLGQSTHLGGKGKGLSKISKPTTNGRGGVDRRAAICQLGQSSQSSMTWSNAKMSPVSASTANKRASAVRTSGTRSTSSCPDPGVGQINKPTVMIPKTIGCHMIASSRAVFWCIENPKLARFPFHHLDIPS
jgi:hypothetical protein